MRFRRARGRTAVEHCFHPPFDAARRDEMRDRRVGRLQDVHVVAVERPVHAIFGCVRDRAPDERDARVDRRAEEFTEVDADALPQISTTKH